MVSATAAPAAAIGPLHHKVARIALHGEITGLVIRGEVGDIKIVAGKNNVARVVAEESYNLTAPQLTYSLKGGLLRVSAPCPRTPGVDVELGLNNCAVDFTVTVPRRVAVDAADDVGDISVRGLHGNEALQTDVGSVTVRSVTASSLLAKASAGGVRLHKVRAKSVTLRSATGDIDAGLIAVPRSVIARCSDGDVSLSVPHGTYAVDVHTAVGSTKVTGITVSASAKHTLTASSADGDVRISGK